ncbi:membrane protein, partial [mine drainage metagenome]
FVVAVALFGRGVPDWAQLVVIAVVVAGLLAIDDILGLPYWTKLVIQILCSLLVAWGFGITIGYVTLPHLDLHLAWAAIPVTVIWLVGMQNSINLLDGVDGLAAGVVAIVGAVLYLAAVNRLLDPGQGGVILLSQRWWAAALASWSSTSRRPDLHGRLRQPRAGHAGGGDHHPGGRQGDGGAGPVRAGGGPGAAHRRHRLRDLETPPRGRGVCPRRRPPS